MDLTSTLHRSTLPNGLRVWIESRPQVESITALLVVNVGSRYETPANNGISHFVEHLVFDGTEKWPTEEAVIDAITHRGGEWNGWTSDETTIYFVQLARSDVALAVEWLSQIVFAPTFPADKIDKERNIIFQEKSGRYSRWLNVLEALGLGYDLDRQVRLAMFPGSALSLRTIGEDAALDRLTRDALIAYHQTHYVPGNCVLILTGSITAAEGEALAHRDLGAVPARSVPARPPLPPLPKRGPQQVTVRGPRATAESRFLIGLRTIAWAHPDRWALEVLAQILDEALHKAIRVQRGLAYDVHAFTDYFTDTGYFAVATQFESRQRALVRRLIDDGFDQIKRGQFTAEQVRHAQAALIGRHTLALEDNLKRAEWLARWASVDDQAPPDYAAAIQAVTVAEVQRVFQTYFTPQRRFVGVHQPIVTALRAFRWAGMTASWGLLMWGLSRLRQRIREQAD